MFFKISAITALAMLANQAMTAPSPVAAAEAPAASSTFKYGTVVTFSQTNYGGPSDSDVAFSIVDGDTSLCTIFKNINTNAKYPVVRSYIATNITCATFPSADCSGSATGTFTSGLKPSVNMNVGSFFCIYQS